MPEAPALLTAEDDIAAFSCGVPELDDWLRRRALANQLSGASRTYVTAADGRVVGYYALAAGSVSAAEAPGRFRRNMPDPVPVVILGRLAIDATCQGRGIGRALFQDAALRILNAAEAIGVRGVLVHAISADARAFYLAIGFDPSPLDEMTLMITLGDLRAAQSS